MPAITKDEFIHLYESANQAQYRVLVFANRFVSGSRPVMIALQKLQENPDISEEERLSCQGILLAYLERRAKSIYNEYMRNMNNKPDSLYFEFKKKDDVYLETIRNYVIRCSGEDDQMFREAITGIIKTNYIATSEFHSSQEHDLATEGIINALFTPDDNAIDIEPERGSTP
ncbi:TPA: hypothetical protein JBE16_12175 [Legionella pneumophila subsp. pneumophila]|uniref:hypothetical protein n=1 Tax=Legionella sp. PATHC039 TaxID=2992042 RepID=UPI001A264CBB|nr:hypothetical protein [Legionella sp. PATHC039]MCW8396846.1 hypothetical protein [Legionella sp. PATHC039]HAT8858153.1 hypothetical protein [Legionella pneumophila subsp. pneumophila]HAT9650279.1 hypothetical protein [Legionella pneumophila subsp. pneumophila]HAT9920937.1 hypothetical protein [Legionella pneumophila subsp. pneumophila]